MPHRGPPGPALRVARPGHRRGDGRPDDVDTSSQLQQRGDERVRQARRHAQDPRLPPVPGEPDLRGSPGQPQRAQRGRRLGAQDPAAPARVAGAVVAAGPVRRHDLPDHADQLTVESQEQEHLVRPARVTGGQPADHQSLCRRSACRRLAHGQPRRGEQAAGRHRIEAVSDRLRRRAGQAQRRRDLGGDQDGVWAIGEQQARPGPHRLAGGEQFGGVGARHQARLPALRRRPGQALLVGGQERGGQAEATCRPPGQPRDRARIHLGRPYPTDQREAPCRRGHRSAAAVVSARATGASEPGPTR